MALASIAFQTFAQVKPAPMQKKPMAAGQRAPMPASNKMQPGMRPPMRQQMQPMGMQQGPALPKETLLPGMLDSLTLSKKPVFTSFREAMKAPLTVYRLHVTNVDKIPTEIDKLKNLQELILTGNSQHSELPGAQLSSLSHLQVLKLRSLGINALPPDIDKLSKLREIDLSGNDINSLPEGIGRLLSLRSVDISNTRVIEIPQNMMMLQRLTTLKSSASMMPPIPSLRTLKIKLMGPMLPDVLGRLPNLKSLTLIGENAIDGNMIKNVLSNSSSLRSLKIENVSIPMTDLSALFTLPIDELSVDRVEVFPTPGGDNGPQGMNPGGGGSVAPPQGGGAPPQPGMAPPQGGGQGGMPQGGAPQPGMEMGNMASGPTRLKRLHIYDANVIREQDWAGFFSLLGTIVNKEEITVPYNGAGANFYQQCRKLNLVISGRVGGPSDVTGINGVRNVSGIIIGKTASTIPNEIVALPVKTFDASRASMAISNEQIMTTARQLRSMETLIIPERVPASTFSQLSAVKTLKTVIIKKSDVQMNAPVMPGRGVSTQEEAGIEKALPGVKFVRE